VKVEAARVPNRYWQRQGRRHGKPPRENGNADAGYALPLAAGLLCDRNCGGHAIHWPYHRQLPVPATRSPVRVPGVGCDRYDLPHVPGGRGQMWPTMRTVGRSLRAMGCRADQAARDRLTEVRAPAADASPRGVPDTSWPLRRQAAMYLAAYLTRAARIITPD